MKHLLPLAGLVCLLSATAARTEVQDCIEITAIPATLSQQGIYCLKQNFETAIPSGNAITIAANNVTIEMNGFKLGGAGAGANTLARGIYSLDRLNVTIRNGTVRGFYVNIWLDNVGDPSLSSGHLVENMRVELPRHLGILVSGTRSTVRDNIVFDVGNGLNNFATGIAMVRGIGHRILNNSVTEVTESGQAIGIYTNETMAPLVRGNQVREVEGGTVQGIFAANSPRALIQDNFVANSTTGNSGIQSSASVDACIDNVVTNFTTAFDGCLVEEGNTTF